jgi:hypothetical protein
MANLSTFFGDAIATGQPNDVVDPRQLPIGVYLHPYVKSWVNQWDYAREAVFWDTSIPTYLLMYNSEWSSTYSTINNPNHTQAGMVGNYYKADDRDGILGGYIIYDPTTDVGNYVDLVNHSGYGGYLNWVMGPANEGQPAGTQTFMKITVDGQDYEFQATLHYRNNEANSNAERLVFGCFAIGTDAAASPYSGGMFGNNYGDMGTGRHNRNTFISKHPTTLVQSMTEQTVTLINPFNISPVRGIQALRFENSIRVQVKNVPPAGAAQSTTAYSNYCAASVTRDLKLPGY